MDKIIFRKLEIKECERIGEINPSQYIGRAWRKVAGKRILVDINFQDNDWPNGYKYHYNHLKNTLLNGGVALGDFDGTNKLLGFATVNRKFFGTKYNYVILDQLFITLEYRNKGLGKQLFMLCV
ncbi:MAG: GNAT family N-acetyltransferase [Clostridium sp.]|uniref:GNAT family N-acetyltransferase n=1 Tax=Clostridium sp. TaxID=1506 RepID=UPI003D6D8111